MKKFLSVLVIALILALTFTSCAFVKKTFYKYDVTFDLNGGVAGEGFVESVTVKYRKTVAMSTPTLENYTFAGWYDGDELYTAETPITKDVTLKARWEFNNTYTLTFDTNGMADVPVAHPVVGELPEIPEAPQVEGYVFAGWYFDAEYTTRYFFDYPLTEATTLYAKFYDTTLGEYTVISNVEQLMAIKDDPTAKYLLACDINCKGETLAPIEEFSGEIEGNGYRIFNFDINEDANNVGFICTNKGTIKNLTFDDFAFDVLVSVSGKKYYGVVCGKNEGIVENCHTSSNTALKVNFRLYTSSSEVCLGGIVGYNSGTIVNCTNNVSISSSFIASGWDGYQCDGYVTHYVAGVCGYVNNVGTVIDCTNLANVMVSVESENRWGHSNAYIAGIVAANLGKIEESKNIGNVDVKLLDKGEMCFRVGGAVSYNTGSMLNSFNYGNINIDGQSDGTNDTLGGFVGYNSGKIYGCYSVSNIKSTVSNTKAVGGFAGYNELLSNHESLINKCFAMGSIELAGVPKNVGNFVGLSTGTIKDAYYADTLVINKVTVTEDENGEATETVETITTTNTIGEEKAESELLSLDFLENTLYFDRMVWFLVDGQLPELR